jgi:hypothetical protein
VVIEALDALLMRESRKGWTRMRAHSPWLATGNLRLY